MSRRGSGQRLARVLEAEYIDSKERLDALRLQTKAWRIMALLAIAEPDYAKRKCGWLMMVSVPYVDGVAVGKFIEENEQRAIDGAVRIGLLVDSSKEV